MKNMMKFRSTLVVVSVIASASLACAETVYQNNTNAYSISDPETWSNNETPSAGNQYIANYTELKTLAGNATFGGDSLTLTGNGNLALKVSTGNVYTIDNLILDGGRIKNTAGSNNVAVGGNITLVADTTNSLTASANNPGGITVHSTISGEGSLLINSSGPVTLDGVGNTYSGGTLLEAGTLIVSTATGLGLGDVTLNAGTSMDLAVANAMDASAQLIIGTDASVDLSFSGTNTISGLSFDGGSTFVSEGVWGSIGSGAQFESAQLIGAGTLNVIPESSSVSILLGVASLLLCKGFRRKNS